MITIDKIETYGWEAAIRGMRNPMNSWTGSDTRHCKPHFCSECVFENECSDEWRETGTIIGVNDFDLMLRLAKSGTDHSKYRRMITVTMDILAPLYWWKEFDTYKVGTVANSCSTMHKIAEKEFTLDDFSHEHLLTSPGDSFPMEDSPYTFDAEDVLLMTIKGLNFYRNRYLATKYKEYWWQMIQLLPTSYNQLRTVQLNYEVLAHIYHSRKDHKLDEWREFCKMIEGLPYSEIITLEEMDN